MHCYLALLIMKKDEENESSPRKHSKPRVSEGLDPVLSDYQEYVIVLMPHLECSNCWEMITESRQRDSSRIKLAKISWRLLK